MSAEVVTGRFTKIESTLRAAGASAEIVTGRFTKIGTTPRLRETMATSLGADLILHLGAAASARALAGCALPGEAPLEAELPAQRAETRSGAGPARAPAPRRVRELARLAPCV